MKPSTVLILGANGRFGLAAARAFARAGWQLRVQTRRAFAPGMPADAVAARSRLGDADALAREAVGATVVVYGVNPAYTRWDEEMLPLARAGMAVAERLGATFMLPGNVYNFGEAMPTLLRDDTPEQPTTQKGRLRCAFEAELAARAQTGGLRSVVVRAGDFYGAGSGNWFDQVIVKSLAAGKLLYPGPLDVAHAWTYLPDLADCFVALAGARDRLGAFERFHFPGPAPTGAQLLGAIEQAAARLGWAPARVWRRGSLPWGAIRLLAWAVPMWRELLSVEYLWRLPHRLEGGRLAQCIGHVPATPLADALLGCLPTPPVESRAAAADRRAAADAGGTRS